MREVQFVGEIDIELQGVIGSTAFLGSKTIHLLFIILIRIEYHK